MHNRLLRLLEFLADNEWHMLPPQGIGSRTIDLGIERGWVQTKRVTIERKAGKETFFMPIRITRLGEIVRLIEQNRLTGRVHPKLREHRLRELRKIVGAGVVRSLQRGASVLKLWRRTTPHNKWVENRRGERLWHSGDGPFLHILTYFDTVKHSEHRILTGLPELVGSDEGAPEESVYRLKKCYC